MVKYSLLLKTYSLPSSKKHCKRTQAAYTAEKMAARALSILSMLQMWQQRAHEKTQGVQAAIHSGSTKAPQKKNILKGTWTNPDRKVQWKLKTKRRDYNDWDPFFTVNKGCIGTWTEFASTNLAMKEFKTSLARISDQY